MNEVDLEDLIQRIREQCDQEKAVVAAYLFGSAASRRIRQGSDVDLAVLVRSESEDNFPLLSFAASLERVCARRVDVVFLNRAGELIKYKVRQSGRLIFERDPKLRKRFEVLGRKRFEDFLYLHQRLSRLRSNSQEEASPEHG